VPRAPRSPSVRASLACALLLAIACAPLARAAAPASAPDEVESKLEVLMRADSSLARAGSPAAAPDERAGYESLGVARARLDVILARREFARATRVNARPAWREWLRDAVRKLVRWFMRPFLGRATTGDVVRLVVMVACVAVMFALVLRVVMRGPRRADDAAAAAPRRLSSAEWARRAHEAAARGARREAVHHAYWAAAHRLAESGRLPFDASRTHRETLRGVPAGAGARAPFERLVGRYERVWFGGAPADDEAWADARHGMEELGCPSDSSAANASS
jgi:hypothetical protein